MTQTNQSDRQRALTQPRAGAGQRDPQAPARTRRDSQSDSASEARYDPDQFTVDSKGVVSLKTYQRPFFGIQTLPVVGRGTGSTAPSTNIDNGLYSANMTAGKEVYPTWDVPEDADHAKTGKLILRFTALKGVITSATITLDTWALKPNELIPTTPDHTAAVTFAIDTIRKNVPVVLPIILHQQICCMRFRVTCSALTVPGPGELHLHAASIRYPTRYVHTHEAD